jgi:flagellar biosynthetic protein FliQ
MDSATVMQLLFSMLILAAKVMAPILITALAVGLLVSLFQAVTQLNDSTLGFLPKMIAVGVVLWLSVPWISTQMVDFTLHVFQMMERARL